MRLVNPGKHVLSHTEGYHNSVSAEDAFSWMTSLSRKLKNGRTVSLTTDTVSGHPVSITWIRSCYVLSLPFLSFISCRPFLRLGCRCAKWTFHPSRHQFGHWLISMLDLAYHPSAFLYQGGTLALLSISAVGAASTANVSVQYTTAFSIWFPTAYDHSELLRFVHKYIDGTFQVRKQQLKVLSLFEHILPQCL